MLSQSIKTEVIKLILKFTTHFLIYLISIQHQKKIRWNDGCLIVYIDKYILYQELSISILYI